LVVPAGYATACGSAAPSDTLTREFPRTHQQVIGAALLASIPVGSSITQLTFRAANFGTVNALGHWPAVNLTFADYEVYIARAARGPGSMSTVFSANVVPGSELRVRDGAMTIPAGSFSNMVAPPGANAWGFDIQVAPFVYNGGDLVVTVRHSGHLSTGTPRLYLDSLANPTPGSLQCMAANTIAATAGAPDQGQPAIARLRYVLPQTCTVNCDGSTTPPVLSANDYMCFFNAYAAGMWLPAAQQITSIANCDGSTSVPVLNIGDFVCFNSKFVFGCP